MNSHKFPKLEKLPALLARTTFSRSSIYSKVKQGMFVPPISLGPRAVAWLSHEVDDVLAAMITGQSQEEIKQLVQDLVVSRKNFKGKNHG